MEQNSPKFDIILAMDERKGLSPEHHEEVNNPSDTEFWEQRGITAGERIKQLREEYVGDDIARQQLDAYEGDNEYHAQHCKYVKALINGDLEQQKELEQWFKTNYPDIK